ncbi:MAG: hypothetical protein WCW02_04115 [Candidatus Buchananbacteria bacterium]
MYELQPFYTTKHKLVISGSVFEFYSFLRSLWLGVRIKRRNNEDDEENETKEKVSEEESRTKSAQRARRTARRLICANSWRWFKYYGNPYPPIYFTLTFSEGVTTLKQANPDFTRFIQILNYEINRKEGQKTRIESKKTFLRYLVVHELMPISGKIHYHALFFNLPYMERIYDRINNVWGKGYFWIETVKVIKNKNGLNKIIGYLLKYMTKNFANTYRQKGQKSYFVSDGLIKPRDIYIEEIVEMVFSKMIPETLEYKKDDIAIERLISMNYSRYNLFDFPELEKEVLALINKYV